MKEIHHGEVTISSVLRRALYWKLLAWTENSYLFNLPNIGLVSEWEMAESSHSNVALSSPTALKAPSLSRLSREPSRVSQHWAIPNVLPWIQ